MKRLLNTVYIVHPEAYVHRDGETLIVKTGEQNVLQVPVHLLSSLVCFGHTMITPPALNLCADYGVAVSFLSEHGRFWCRMVGPTAGNVLLRRQQYRLADSPEACSKFSRAFIAGKVSNSRLVLSRALRDYHKDGPIRPELQQVIRRLSRLLMQVEQVTNLEALRGIEGEAAAIYFQNFNAMITAQSSVFRLEKRTKHPPTDPMNCLLSFLYTILMHDVASALESVGLDPAVGFLHRDRPGRLGLALDLMEELRPLLADRLALTLINRRQVQSTDFIVTETGTFRMTDNSRKQILAAYQRRKQEEILHPVIEEKVPLGLVPFVQANLLARTIRGDSPDYLPYIAR